MKYRPTDGPAQARLFADPFDGFGPSRFRPADEAATADQVSGKRTAKLRAGVQEHAPRAPGVYGMIDESGRIIYVGKAKSLRTRLFSYFRVKSRDPKAGRIIALTRLLVWEQSGDELAALLRELELIQSFRPRFNVLGLPGLARHHYICLGKPPAPGVHVSNKPTGKELAVYGPLIVRHKSEEAVRRLNHCFQLRDCPQTVRMAFADQPELFEVETSAKCLRFELQTCMAPCAAGCTRRDYSRGVRGAKAFLDGRDRTLLESLRNQMEEASSQFEFEKATAARDRLQALEWLDARLSMLRRARDRNSFVYPLRGQDDRERWYLIHRGQVRAVCHAPRSAEEKRETARMLKATFGSQPGPVVLKDAAIDSVLLVSAWFRKHEAERTRLMTQAQAAEKCRLA